MGERLLCKQEVVGSIPIASTGSRRDRAHEIAVRRVDDLRTACSLTA